MTELKPFPFCGGAAAKESWAYWKFCPNCGAHVIGGE